MDDHFRATISAGEALHVVVHTSSLPPQLAQFKGMKCSVILRRRSAGWRQFFRLVELDSAANYSQDPTGQRSRLAGCDLRRQQERQALPRFGASKLRRGQVQRDVWSLLPPLLD